MQDMTEDYEIEDVEIDEATVQDILVELRACLPTCPAAELAGLRAAIEIIESNYTA